jgi:hypothetical protein
MKWKETQMQENPGILDVAEPLDGVEHCPECGRPWVDGEPVHFVDCRYFVLEDDCEDGDEETEKVELRSDRGIA